MLRYFPILTILLTGLLFFTGITGCSGTQQTTDQADQQRDITEKEALYWARIDSARMNFTQADVDFMTGMIGHHAQAIIMSRLAPENGASRSVQTLASRIINAQGDEINLMQNWLRDRDQPVPEVAIDGLNLEIRMKGGHEMHNMHDPHNMPGMLTQEQLVELSNARGREFDRLFLTYMIAHHQGAVTMVETLFNSDGAASGNVTFELASGINADQVTEIERMKLMLENLSESR